ncbi:MAG: type II toxin-antitoxin system VapC family toxin [Candidatus Bipolaricaulia bacterium]
MVKRAIVDASVVMAAMLPGEPTRPAAHRILEQFTEGALELVAPSLLPYEVTNSLLKAVRWVEDF